MALKVSFIFQFLKGIYLIQNAILLKTIKQITRIKALIIKLNMKYYKLKCIYKLSYKINASINFHHF